MAIQNSTLASTDTRSDLHRGEARAGSLAKVLLLAVGLGALWYSNGGSVPTPSLVVCGLYALTMIAFVGVFSRPFLGDNVVRPLVVASYVIDLVFVSLLIAGTGGITSDLYVLYAPLALKAAVYYPNLPVLLPASYLIGPLYAIALRLSAGGWWYLLDPAFVPRYVMLFAIIFTAMFMAWLFERRQEHIAQLSQGLNAKAEVLEETATGLGDRLIELRTLQEGIKAINSALALDELLQLIVVNASQVLGVAQCLVLLLDDEAGDVVARAASGMPPGSYRGVRFRLGEGVAGLVVQTGKPILIGDGRGDPRFIQVGDFPVVSEICVPLISDNRAVGALMATSRKRNAFHEDDLSLLAAFADQAAIAVKNAALYERLTIEKRRTEAIIHGLGDGVIVTDARLNVTLLNPVASGILGVPESQAAGAPVSRLMADQALADLLQRALLDKAAPVVREIPVPGRSGEKQRVYHVLATTVTDESGAVLNIIAVLRDITSRKEVEEMKSNFLSVVSHELKTPLHSIKGFVDIILMGKTGRINETQRDFLTIVKTQTTQLQNQINDLLEFSRLEAGQIKLRIEDVSMPEVAAAVVSKLNPLASDGQIALSCSFNDGFPSIQGDRGRLEQVVTNLVDNAIKFTPANGAVTISGSDVGEYIRVSVRDTGIGIPADALPNVFDRFYQVDSTSTRSYRGTGLGLTICKHIVEQHQGRIWVESVQNEGSTFSFELPRAMSVRGDEAALDFSAFPTSLDDQPSGQRR